MPFVGIHVVQPVCLNIFSHILNKKVLLLCCLYDLAILYTTYESLCKCIILQLASEKMRQMKTFN